MITQLDLIYNLGLIIKNNLLSLQGHKGFGE